MLLEADADGPDWCKHQVAKAYGCREGTVENMRQRCVLEGFGLALYGWQKAALIVLRLGPPPAGYGPWSLRLRGREAVEVGIC